MKVLVTGGAGFIGSAVCRYFVREKGAEVINLDKLTYAANQNSLAAIESEASYHFIRGDICDAALLEEVFRRFEPDAVLHLAAESHVDRSIAGSDDFVRTNILGTHRLLEAARQYWEGLPEARRRAFRFLHVSTDEVYGSLGKTGLFGETTAYSPNSPYAASKAAADHLAAAWFHTYGLPVLITNCSNNYGPYQFPEKLIPLMILNALEEKPLPIYGRGDNVRDWLYVDDHARALGLVLQRGQPGEKYNIGGRNERTNLDVVEAICDYLDSVMPPISVANRRELITFVADRPGHDHRYAIDARKIESEIGWQAQENFETGLARTTDWYIANESWWQPLRAHVYGGERLGLHSGRGRDRTTRRPVLIVGRSGQVAQALAAHGFGQVPHVALGRDVADLTNPEALKRAFAEHCPQLVVNAAAYTSVDLAESERELAFAVNRDGPAQLARLCAEAKIPLVHLSTDYVFDGMKNEPYREDDPVSPLNIYGISKAEGEAAIRASLHEHVILRTSWVYSDTGDNFVKKMLRLGEARDEISIVDDQQGTPTLARDIAKAIAVIVRRIGEGRGVYGTFHIAGSGETSWHGFAQEIFAQAHSYGRKVPNLIAIPTSAFSTAAIRPANSRLACERIAEAYGVRLPHWRESLANCLDVLLARAEVVGAS